MDLLLCCKVLFQCKVSPLQNKLTIFIMPGTSKQKITEILRKLFCGKIQIICNYASRYETKKGGVNKI